MNAILEINHLTLNMTNSSQPILTDITYQIYPDDFIILLGNNGSGKSSLLKCIDGRYQPHFGSISIRGVPLKNPFKQGIMTITQQSHESLFSSLTTLEHFLLFKKNHESIEFFSEHLHKFNENLPAKLNQTVDQLSGGEKQALILALTFLYPPNVLLLDEHTSALDPKSAEKIMAITHHMITKHQITCLMTTHDLKVAARYGNRVLALKHGKMIQAINREEKSSLKQKDLLAVCY